MAYFGGTQNLRGDPGFFDTFKRIAGGFVRGGPIGAITSAFTPPPRQQRVPAIGRGRPQAVVPVPGLRGTFERALPFGRTGFQVGGADMRPRRRRMNVGNTKALRRAIRRTDGFVRLARSALKNTGFKIVSKSSGRMTEAQWQKRAHHAK